MARDRILISACLLGECVRYDGGHLHTDDEQLRRWLAEGRLVPVCPEVAGGLAVPRPPAEIEGPGGAAVLAGRARVIDVDGGEVSRAFVAGAQRTLAEARTSGARLAILKDGSPSCGSSYIYDGSFSGARRPGRGVTTALLEQNGVKVFTESDIDGAAARLAGVDEQDDRGEGPGAGETGAAAGPGQGPRRGE